jgi:hypothetical protein
MELLELGELAGGSLSNVQAEVAVEVPHLQRPREVAWFGAPDHAAGILVLACPLLNNGPIGLGAVPGIHAQGGGGSVRPVGGDEATAPRGIQPGQGNHPLVIEGHQVGERPELVGLDGWGPKTRVASVLLDGQAVQLEVAVLWSRRETFVAPDIDQRDQVVSTKPSHGAADVPGRRWKCVRWRYAGVSACRQRCRDQDHNQYREAFG